MTEEQNEAVLQEGIDIAHKKSEIDEVIDIQSNICIPLKKLNIPVISVNIRQLCLMRDSNMNVGIVQRIFSHQYNLMRHKNTVHSVG